MGEVTLKVPAEYTGHFQRAVVSEIIFDADWVSTVTEELERRLLNPDPPRKESDDRLADIRGAARFLGAVVEVADQIFEADCKSDVCLRGETDALAHLAETMANKIVTPMIAEETNTCPYGDEAVRQIGALTKELGWAAGESARLQALVGAEVREEKAEVS